MVKVVDNILSKEEFEKLKDVMLGSEFPWYFLPDKVHSGDGNFCLLYTSPSPRDMTGSRMPSSA